MLLFSQFTQMLDIMEVFLEQEGRPYLRFDGKTPVAERCSWVVLVYKCVYKKKNEGEEGGIAREGEERRRRGEG